jgi:hypothetical protein
MTDDITDRIGTRRYRHKTTGETWTARRLTRVFRAGFCWASLRCSSFSMAWPRGATIAVLDLPVDNSRVCGVGHYRYDTFECTKTRGHHDDHGYAGSFWPDTEATKPLS